MIEIDEAKDSLLVGTTDIVVSYVSNNPLTADGVPALIQSVYNTLAELGQESPAPEARPEPAVSVRASLKRDHIVCLEDGKKMKILKRHLMTDHGMTPGEYRTGWGLASDYPMVAPDYADKRRDLAMKIGLGRKPGQRRGRRKKTTA